MFIPDFKYIIKQLLIFIFICIKHTFKKIKKHNKIKSIVKKCNVDNKKEYIVPLVHNNGSVSSISIPELKEIIGVYKGYRLGKADYFSSTEIYPKHRSQEIPPNAYLYKRTVLVDPILGKLDIYFHNSFSEVDKQKFVEDHKDGLFEWSKKLDK